MLMLLAKLEWYESVGFKWLVVLAVVAACYALGIALGRALRMADYGWKIGVVLAAMAVAPVLIWARWPPNLGVDLNGGMILIYEINEQAKVTSAVPDEEDPDMPRSKKRGPKSAQGEVNMATLASQLMRRINPSGTLEIKVRQYGERGIEIIVPETDPEEVARIKRLIEKAGVLEFMIVADNVRDQDLIELASTPAEKEQTNIVWNRGQEKETIVGRWVKVGRELEETKGVRPPLAVDVRSNIIRDARTKARIFVPPNIGGGEDEKGKAFAAWLETKSIDEVEVLMVYDAKVHITGAEIPTVRSDFDDKARPCVSFQMSAHGASLMARLTSANTPDPNTGHRRLLGIVLDSELLSAPSIQGVISDNGQITGQFKQKDVDELVGILRGGSLDTVLIKEPVSENPIGAELGRDTIQRGMWSSIISLLGVLVFMMLYYRFSGIVAVWTLIINLLLMMAIMVLFHATFTLSGIAGIVLTMGMAVDANVLIFERIREELARGAALRMALRNGFSRATTTIIDSNLTTLITAVVLYVIGTDQIRGFAVTLILGIVLSMFAAIFCARLVFDIAERKKWITRLTMIKLMTETKFNFMNLWQVTTAISLIVIFAGIAGTFMRRQEILGIDFTGGTAVHLELKQQMPVEQVRARLTAAFDKAGKAKGETLQFNLVNVPTNLATKAGEKPKDPETVFKVDSNLTDVDELKSIIQQEFIKEGTTESLLAQNVLTFNPSSLKTVISEANEPASTGPAKKPAATPSSTTDFPDPAGETEEKTPEKDSEKEAKAPEKVESTDPEKPATEKPATEKKDPEAKETEKNEPAEPKSESESAKPDGAALTPNRGELLALADDVVALLAQDDPAKTEEEPKEKPAEEPKEKPADEAKEKPVDDPKEEPVDDPKEKPVDAPEDKPADKPETEDPEMEAPGTAKPESGGDLPKTETGERKVFTEFDLSFSQPIGRNMLREKIKNSAQKVGITLLDNNVDLRPEGGGEVTGVTKRNGWKAKLPTDEAQTRQIVADLQTSIDNEVHWPSWNKIGPTIADKMKKVAVFALLASCLGIIAYIWFRFEKIMYGLAAVVAVIHDVLIMLAAIALSHWLYGVLGFAGIEDFKIGMIEVAAFLTIIGYSLNDTIVIFDRIREIKGKSPNINSDMINQSVNQTLSRTMLTSITTLIVIVILYFFGGQAVHGFAFAMLVGVLSGTYSTVFIASPLLLWMSKYGNKTAKTATKAAA